MIDWDAVLADAVEPTPEQAAYIAASDRGENVGAILTPSKWFTVGARAAIAKVRAALIAEKGGAK